MWPKVWIMPETHCSAHFAQIFRAKRTWARVRKGESRLMPSIESIEYTPLKETMVLLMEGGKALVQVPGIELTTSTAKESGKIRKMDTLVSFIFLYSPGHLPRIPIRSEKPKFRTWVAFTVRSCSKASCAPLKKWTCNSYVTWHGKTWQNYLRSQNYLCIFSPWQNHLHGHASPKFPCGIVKYCPQTSSCFALLSSLFSVVSGIIPSASVSTAFLHLLSLAYCVCSHLTEKVTTLTVGPLGG